MRANTDAAVDEGSMTVGRLRRPSLARDAGAGDGGFTAVVAAVRDPIGFVAVAHTGDGGGLLGIHCDCDSEDCGNEN